MEWIGFQVMLKQVFFVHFSIEKGAAPILQNQGVFNLEEGDRSKAYVTMYQTLSNFLSSHVSKRIVIKASTVAFKEKNIGVTTLQAAELRGIVILASEESPNSHVALLQKQSVTKKSSRKVDAYVADKAYWEANNYEIKYDNKEIAVLVLKSIQNEPEG